MEAMATAPAIDEWRWCLHQQARAPRMQTLREFAERNFVLPDGPFQGRRFRCDRQPYSGLFFDAVDSGLYNTIAATGPVQSGKSIVGYVLPVMYHACELGETVILGVPNLAIANDKWQNDLLPAFAASRYADLLPRAGAGSRGGLPELIKLRNGAGLRFMTAGGGDKSRAGFTARVVVITEVDGMDMPGAASRETDKVSQLIARTRAYGNRRRVYLECTTTTERGRIWSEYVSGTESNIACPCVHCGEYVTPGREHLRGWRDAENIIDAAAAAHFVCPACGETIDDDARARMNAAGVLVHRGQRVDRRGRVLGDAPRTSTLGFRWSAFNNLLVHPRDIAADEWRAARATDEDNAEREMNQYVWTLPHKPAELEAVEITADGIAARKQGNPRGQIPEAATCVTVGVDVGKWLLHYVAVAWLHDARAIVVDYGRAEVASDAMAVERAIQNALRELRDQLARGYPHRGNATPMLPALAWIDCGYKPTAVFAFCRESKRQKTLPTFQPCRGFGDGQRYPSRYRPQVKVTGDIHAVGEQYYLRYQRADAIGVWDINADYWKTAAHERFAFPIDQPGALTLFDALPNEHLSFTKHLTAEQLVEEYDPRLGTTVKRWKQLRRQNHYFDATVYALAAGHRAGARLVGEQSKPPAVGTRSELGVVARLRMPDGRPYLITER